MHATLSVLPIGHMSVYMSFFSQIQPAPEDPILGLNARYHADPRPEKVNLGIGIYYDENAHIPLLASVQAVEEQLLHERLPRNYLPIDGLARYNQATLKLVFGDNPLVASRRATCIQTIGSSAALRVGAECLKHLLPHASVAISAPSWDNHTMIFKAAGYTVHRYRYYDPTTHGVCFREMIDDLSRLEPATVVLLHACCHNPTGADLTREQWLRIAQCVKDRQLFPFVDMAYQGFSQGLEEDAFAARVFAQNGVDNYFVANSYSKIFALYGERVGALSIVTPDARQTAAVVSVAKHVIRSLYSSPALHGAHLVAGVLLSPNLYQQWESELALMRCRLDGLRHHLVDQLTKLGHPSFGFIKEQSGMFSFSGLSAKQVDTLRTTHGIYMIQNGRLCLAGLNATNMQRVATAIAAVCDGQFIG